MKTQILGKYETAALDVSLPALRQAFAPVTNREQALAMTRQLTRSHYENFSVVSILLPRALRQDFCNVYAFCRMADDLTDEIQDKDVALDALTRFRDDLRACFAGEARSAVYVALRTTIDAHQVPIQPFLDLLSAFEQDQHVKRYETFEQVLDYCRRSADPVGRLVLWLCGYRDAERQALSDKTCTALQLTNFWQDVRRDILERDRIYIPTDSMRRFSVTETQIREGRCDDNYRALIRFECDRAENLFKEGDALVATLRPGHRAQVALFAKGGRAVLDAIRRQNYDTLTRRPALSRWTKARLVLSTLVLGARWEITRRGR